MLRQHHIRDADAGRKAPGAGGKVDNRPIGSRHPLQARQGAGVEPELRIVIVLDDVPLTRLPGCPVQQLRPPTRRHGNPRWELVAGCDVADRRTGSRQGLDGQPVLIHRQAAAGHAVVFQHLLGAGVARVFHGRHARQQRSQQPQQVFQPGSHHDLIRTALDAPVFLQILRQCLPQFGVALRVAVGQQLRRGIQQFLLEPRPRPERKQPRIHPPGGEVEPHRPRSRFRSRCGQQLRLGQRRLRMGGQSQIFLYIKAAPLPGCKVALRR